MTRYELEQEKIRNAVKMQAKFSSDNNMLIFWKNVEKGLKMRLENTLVRELAEEI